MAFVEHWAQCDLCEQWRSTPRAHDGGPFRCSDVHAAARFVAEELRLEMLDHLHQQGLISSKYSRVWLRMTKVRSYISPSD